MHRKIIIALACFLLSTESKAGENIFENPKLIDSIEACVNRIYNYEFEKAVPTIHFLEKEIPNYPLSTILWSMYYFWKNFPISPKDADSQNFVDSLYRCIHITEKIIENEKEDKVANLLLLTSRAFLMMFYADNGNYMKAMEHVYPGYKITMRSFNYANDISEFHYYTGLFNYYREEYPKAHPVYKPVVYFLKRGSRQKGLDDLKYTSENSIFMNTEAMAFLILIYLNYENDFVNALHYAEKLHEKHPNNRYYHAKYIELLLLNNHFNKAGAALYHLDSMPANCTFIKMNLAVFKGMLEEKYSQNYNIALYNYNMGLRLGEEITSYDRTLKSYAYLGLSRIYLRKEKEDKAAEYYKKAVEMANYDYILRDYP